MEAVRIPNGHLSYGKVFHSEWGTAQDVVDEDGQVVDVVWWGQAPPKPEGQLRPKIMHSDE
jgi:hypothetical protein